MARAHKVMAMALILAVVAAGVGLAEAPSRPATPDPSLPPLETVLERLDRTSQLYLDYALRFTCDETILHVMGNGQRAYRFNYIYAFSEDRGLRDHRLTRRGWNKVEQGAGDVRPREVRLTDYGLPTWMSRAYNWIFLFESGRWQLYDYRLLGRESRLGRPALVVRFEPRKPHVERLNDWVGTAWIDAERFQLLHVEAQRLEDYQRSLRLERDLEESREWKPRRKETYSIFTATTTYGVERGGIRFPSEVELEATQHVVRGGKRPPRSYEYPAWRVRQSYDNYRLFGIETRGSIGRYFDRR